MISPQHGINSSSNNNKVKLVPRVKVKAKAKVNSLHNTIIHIGQDINIRIMQQHITLNNNN